MVLLASDHDAAPELAVARLAAASARLATTAAPRLAAAAAARVVSTAAATATTGVIAATPSGTDSADGTCCFWARDGCRRSGCFAVLACMLVAQAAMTPGGDVIRNGAIGRP